MFLTLFRSCFFYAQQYYFFIRISFGGKTSHPFPASIHNEGKSAARCQFLQNFMSSFFIWKFLRSFYVLTIWVCDFLAKRFRHKSCWL